MSVIQIPQTDSIAELAQFWDSHSVTDFEDQLEEVTEPVFDRESLLTIYLPSAAAGDKENLNRRRKPKGVSRLFKIPLLLTPQLEGGFTVTSPLLPELVTEGDTIDEALENARDALTTVVEAYEDAGRSLPASIQLHDQSSAILVETLLAAA